MDEDENNADVVGGLGEREDPTPIVGIMVTREAVSGAIRKVATACGGLRQQLHEAAALLDAGTAAGLTALTKKEAALIDEDLAEIEGLFAGVRRGLKRSVGPGPTEEP